MYKPLLAALALIASVNLSATVYTGTCGPELSYSLDSGTGALVITGRGQMTDGKFGYYPLRDYITSVSFPEGLTSVGYDAFAGCYRLTSITLPDSVTEVENTAFRECSALTNANLGKGLKVLGNQAFRDCSALRKVRWSDCLESIGDWAFENCENLGDTIFFPSTLKQIGSKPFSYNGSSKVAVWNVKRIADFNQYSGLGNYCFSRIVFGDSVEYIPANLARYMGNEIITLPESVREIGESAFADCSRLKRIDLPDSIQSIGNGAFQKCKSLKSLVLPDALQAVSDNLCSDCTALEFVAFMQLVKSIGYKAFAGDTSLVIISCMAPEPPTLYDTSFEGVPDSACVYAETEEYAIAYKATPYWSRFTYPQVPDDLPVGRVIVDAAETTATFTWPTDQNAASYEIDIYKDGSVFCKLTLGPKGQLLGISFSAPQRNQQPSIHNLPSESTESNTLSFMVTGLEEASRYTFVLSTLDENNTPLHVYIGDFATTGYEGDLKYPDGYEITPTPPIIPYDPDSAPITTGDAVNNASAIHGGSVTPTFRLMHDGRLLFVTPSGTYDITGKRIE